MPCSLPPPRRRKIPLWDIVLFAGLALAAFVVTENILSNMADAGLSPGFSFLANEAGFQVSESLIPYASSNSYARVILVGLVNTLFLAGVSLILANTIGLAVGLVSVGPSPLGRTLALAYVEVFRNLPKILVLLVLYVVVVNTIPPVRDAISFAGIHLSNRALYLPTVVPDPRQLILLGSCLVGCALAYTWHRHAVAHQARTGRRRPSLAVGAILILGLPALSTVIFDVPIEPSVPRLDGFDFEGGLRLSMPFLVVAVTLGLYHGSQIAEVIRGGIAAVPTGQHKAAAALGFNRRQSMRLIILPQVIRIVIPPMGNQCVNLVKNTSIAIAVGYSDLMSVPGTTINQTFRPLEMMLLTMALYLALCIGLTTVLNRWNRSLRHGGKGLPT